MTEPEIVAIVLAGGASSRFGADKLAAALDGRPLLHHALEAVAEVVDHIVVVIAPEAPAPSVQEALAARVVFARDAATHGGPLAGLAAGLVAGLAAGLATGHAAGHAAVVTPVRDEAPHIGEAGSASADPIVLVVGGDMPGLVPAVLRLLVETLAADPSLAVMTLAASDPAPLPMAVRPAAARTAVDAILASGGRRSLRALLAAVPAAELDAESWRMLDPSGATLRDIDTPTDLGDTDLGAG